MHKYQTWGALIRHVFISRKKRYDFLAVMTLLRH